MNKIFYSEKPSVFQEFQNGAVSYRWNIIEEMSSDGEIRTSQWSCSEVTIYSPISKEKLTQAVITSIWDNDYEKKLINDYNGAKNELFDIETNQKYIDAYNEFLVQRKAIKEQIQLDWNNKNKYMYELL